jgi:hypothetical protein
VSLIDRRNARELLGGELGGGGDGDPFSGALVLMDADETIPNLGAASLPWSVAQYDVGGWLVSPGDRFLTVPEGVTRVQMASGVLWGAAGGAGFKSICFRHNGNVFPGGTTVFEQKDVGQSDSEGIGSPVIEVAAEDTFAVEVFQVTGFPIDVSAVDTTFFGIWAVEGHPLSGGVNSFRALNDTPSNYTGEGGKHVFVNAAEDAIEFGQALSASSDVRFNGLTTGGGRYKSFRPFATSATTLTLGRREIYGCTNTDAPRTLTIKTADIVTGVLTPWIFTVKDQSGGANANNITIVCEGGQLIDGASSMVISEDFGSVTLYTHGINLFSI